MVASSQLNSDGKGDGLKNITQAVRRRLEAGGPQTYVDILEKIEATNSNTLRRRVYDVLSVMRALNLVVKNSKTFCLVVDGREVLAQDNLEKRAELERLKKVEMYLNFIVSRNKTITQTVERFYFPFMIVHTCKKSSVHCETNEERSFFKFRCDNRLEVLDDLSVLREIYELKEQETMTFGMVPDTTYYFFNKENMSKYNSTTENIYYD